ncbi:MAG: ATP-dependent zinc metalloprotease FtsH [Phycisphaerales bacterium]|nr:ATP-dependent zinc metalloprotease FtsH [Phycisphaerales bacterium]MCI0631616.1 ATP-dependent zinc metalloprotease FtsH [Phycisphaerales bacterium]MCI0674300.1 ATP-dependent zinc metalloprotease FtsH [Phycisphaerales bacterium]
MTQDPKANRKQPARIDPNPVEEGDAAETRPGKPQAPPPVKISRGLMSWVVILALLIMLFIVLNSSKRGTPVPSWNAFLDLIVQPEVNADGTPKLGVDGKPVYRPLIENNLVTVEDTRLIASLKESATIKGTNTTIAPGSQITLPIDGLNRDIYLNKLEALGVDHIAKTGVSIWTQLLVTLAPFLLVIALIWFFIARSMRSAGAGPGGMLGSFGKSRHRISSKDMVNVTFNDVAGVDEAKEEVAEIVEFLKNPKKFQRLGGRIPRGVLLVGAPGCGKTLLAKAIAGEADVPFFSISGSDFVEMFVGVGASRVRDLFKQAKENSPCIIFLDEIDAVGRRRGGGFTTGGHDEREQTLNAILVEMDGFEANDQIIVIAATNRADVLDPALTRPGRFDRQVHVPLPDLIGRRQILEVHAKKVKLSPDVDLERVARGTPMFSGADLAALINEGAILATMAGKDYVEHLDLEEARDKIRFGRARKSRKIEEKERVATAYHEAGHAVVQVLLEDADPVHKVTIIPRGMAMGATFSLPEKDRYGYGRRYLLASMRVLCGGRIAEQRKTADVSSGAAMDIQMVTQYARHMILEWGMSEKLGFVNYAGSDTRETFIPEKDYSDGTAKIIDEEVKQIIDEAYADATRLLDQNWDKVVGIAEALLKYETLQSEDIKRLMRGERLGKPTVSELLEAASASGKDKTVAPAPKPLRGPEEEPDSGMMPQPA